MLEAIAVTLDTVPEKLRLSDRILVELGADRGWEYDDEINLVIEHLELAYEKAGLKLQISAATTLLDILLPLVREAQARGSAPGTAVRR